MMGLTKPNSTMVRAMNTAPPQPLTFRHIIAVEKLPAGRRFT
jgi:hypothetical protein